MCVLTQRGTRLCSRVENRMCSRAHISIRDHKRIINMLVAFDDARAQHQRVHGHNQRHREPHHHDDRGVGGLKMRMR